MYQLDFTVIWDFRQELLHGLLITVQLTVIGCILALCIGTLMALLRTSSLKLLRVIGTIYVEFFRNIPLLIQMFFWYYGIFNLLYSYEPIKIWFKSHDEGFWAALAGLTMYTSAYMAEVIRSGLSAVPKGQWEAAKSSGLNYWQTMKLIILPQTFRIILPPLTSQFLNLMKNSAIALAVATTDLMYMVDKIESETFRGLEAAIAAMVLYIMLSLVIVSIMSFMRRYFKLEWSA
jgi:polar amino acid transport system permease protein